MMLLRLLVTVSLLQGGLCYFPPLGLFSLYADRVYYIEMLKEVAAICGNDKKVSGVSCSAVVVLRKVVVVCRL